MKKVLILVNSIGGFYSFRKELAIKLIEENYKVYISSPEVLNTEQEKYFKNMGCNVIETKIERRGTNPIKDLRLMKTYVGMMKQIKPDLVLTYTIKPTVYGSLACQILKIPYINNITGLGTSIQNKGIVRNISLFLYKTGLRKSSCVFFQNEENKKILFDENIIKSKTRLVPGSGVNLNENIFEEYNFENEIIKILFIGRLMKDKGSEELLSAADKIKSKYKNIQFDFIGSKEGDYKGRFDEYINKNIVNFYGLQNKEGVHNFIKNSSAVINPSYHEGMSNVLLEAAATGRPVLASDIPGCRETFDEGVSGFGFKPKDVHSLVSAIEKFINLPYEQKKAMGIAGRKKMEAEFDRNIVIDAYMKEIENILK